MNKTEAILRVLTDARSGLAARTIFNRMEQYVEHYEIESLRVFIAQMKVNGLVYVDGVTECSCCGHVAACYRITEKGRLRLQHYKEKAECV